ncbi:MAG TPA: hypothetical protein DGG95_02715 [Cytophagales bacterium]|jgi:hypothetical protein|nr:hypothetical protein [Cytophagales bacterium]
MGGLLFCFFFATSYASILLTLEKAKPALRYSVYFLNLVLGLSIFSIPKAMGGKLFFITLKTDGSFKVVEPLGGFNKTIPKDQVKGFSKSSKDSSRKFVRLYFETRSSVTMLPYYWTLKRIESKLQEQEIQFLGEEKFHFDFWGRPVGEKF